MAQPEAAATSTDADRPLVNQRSFEWNHGLGETVTALIRHGLRLDWLIEHDWTVWPHFRGWCVPGWHLDDTAWHAARAAELHPAGHPPAQERLIAPSRSPAERDRSRSAAIASIEAWGEQGVQFVARVNAAACAN
jgi:hypothetical protein